MTHCLVLAAGKGERVKSRKYSESKQYQEVNDISPLNYLLRSLDKIDEIKTITVVIAKGDASKFKKNSKNIKKLRKSVIGGKTRQESSFKGLKNIDREFGKKRNQKVIIHDAARPFVSKDLINSCIKNLDRYQAVCPVIKIDDTLKKVSKKNQLISENRDKIVCIQTPQGFKLKEIISLHEKTKEKFTDDISLALEKKIKIKLISGSKENFKITNTDDLEMFGQIILGKKINLVGIGFDIHEFTKGDQIKLGGLKFKSKYGLLANSDGDVLLHAITDSIFGAFNSGDLGLHFPPESKLFKNKNSIYFLKKSLDIIKEKNGSILNLDLNLICDYPKIKPIRREILKKISSLLSLNIDKVSLKATSTEDQGFINSKNGIAAQAIISLEVLRNEK